MGVDLGWLRWTLGRLGWSLGGHGGTVATWYCHICSDILAAFPVVITLYCHSSHIYNIHNLGSASQIWSLPAILAGL